MPAWLRAGLFAALFVFAAAPLTPVQSAEKTFQDADLDDAAITLEADLKDEAGTVEKPVIALRKDADTALRKSDVQGAADTYVQIVTVAPNDAAAWRRLADLWLKIPTTDEDDGTTRYERATTASYIAYQRSSTAAEEANSLIMLATAYGKRSEWRPALNALRLALKLDETQELKTTYDSLREKYGFRVANFSVDSDAASPRACFQFTEALPKRTDFSPFVAVAGQDKPALSVDDQQLCVEGLKHGESYSITLRQGLPSTVDENLLKTADFNIYVRDRSPFVRLAGKAYVLPKTGQQGIPLVSVNTDTIKVTIYRIGDRNLIDQVLGDDFERNLAGYTLNDIAEQKGEKVWTGEMKAEKELNTEVTTNFPVNEAVPALDPGVYVLAAEPASVQSDEYNERATQWFIVSDLGLTAYSGSDGVHAFVNSLATTAPVVGVELRLIARNNEVLATKTTDQNGRVAFEPGLSRGEGGLAPALLVASLASGDYAFLSLKASPFDLTDRGVAGRDAPTGLDAYVFTERGVYRTGETVHVTALLRNPVNVAVPDVPLTLVVTRSDGVEYRRNVVPDQGIGGRALDVPIISSAPTGTWRVAAFADPKQPAIGEATFLVEDYVPDRLEFDLTTTATSISPASPAKISVDGRFLYGAPASGLTLDGEVNIAKVTELPGFAGYVFGLDDKSDADQDDESDTIPLADLPETDSAGKATFTATLDKVPASTRPLQAEIVVRMAEAGGRAIERKLTLPITPSAPMIGVKPLFTGKALGDSDTASFDVVMVAPDGKPMAKTGLHWQLLRVDSKYQWYRSEGYWQFEAVKVTRRIADGTIDVTPDKPGRIAVPVTWGRYRLELTTADPQGPETTFGFDSGWYAEASADTPDLLEIALDKPEYRPGDSMTVAVTARTAGEVTLAVIGDKLLSTTTAHVEPGTAKLPLSVGADWGTGAYVLATLRRPLDVEAKRMPGRAIGVAWFAIDKAAHTLGVSMDLPDRIRPETALRVPIKLAGLTPGDEARIVVSAVDVGILNLTNYKAPAPEDYFLGQRKLSAEVRDLYGQLIDGMQGTKGQIRTGGDSGEAELQGSPPTQAPLALYSGIVTVGADGTAETSFDIPAFAGTVRVMAVAWSKDKVGHASADVIVRDPVVVTATLPRFLLLGDKSTIRLDLDNVEGESGNYQVAVTGDGPLALSQANKTISLDAKKRAGLSLPVEAKGVGAGTVTVNVTGPGDFAAERRYALDVKPSAQILARRTVKPLEPGQTLTLNRELFAALDSGTGKLALSVTPSAALDVAGLLQALDRYPLGCTEQIVSRALPLLYANELSVNLHLAVDTGLDQRIADAIETVLARQGSEGAFGLWSAGGDDAWLDAYVTDFLTRARARGFSVPDEAFKLAIERLRNYVSTAPEPATDGGLALAYALYVLARNGVAPVGDVRYLADAKINDLKTATAKAEIGAALAMLGDRIRAEKVFDIALNSLAKEPKIEIGRTDYGSPLRDAAVLVTLAAEGDAAKPILVNATERVDAARNLVQRTSTQEDAWLVLAARALGKQNVSLNVEEAEQVGPYYATYNQADIEQSDVTVTNTGDTPVDTVVTVSGSPTSPEPAADHGFKIERSFHTLGGADAEVTHAKQNQRFVVLLKITDAQPQFARVALIDYLPAGFEIDNPRLVSSGDTGTLDWIEDAGTPVHTEFRDDRFTAAFDRTNSDPAVFTVAYVVRAVSPGDYVLPQAEVEDMYRPDRFGRTGTGKVGVQAAK
ncbi:MG2 domain-containing protein [Methyloceanibacter sp.]|uniref:alpha-2-macroglobulin family protein n=1 Tax=Methyloceanibacter sp. TaxID=1965321 RepID=UPI003D6D8EB7